MLVSRDLVCVAMVYLLPMAAEVSIDRRGSVLNIVKRIEAGRSLGMVDRCACNRKRATSRKVVKGGIDSSWRRAVKGVVLGVVLSCGANICRSMWFISF